MAEKELWRVAMNAWDEASPQKEGIQAEWQRVVDAISKELLREDEPVAWQYRTRGTRTESEWSAWSTVGHKPQGPEDRHFSMRPLFDRPAPKVPAGWQLVPKEPTEYMEKAGWEASDMYPAEIYRSMLAAAPKGETE